MIDRIVATLGLKEMSQSTLIRKLCALSQHNPTRKAVFEFDKLVRSIYTLDYIRDPQLQRDVHRSQNRIEAYHQLRSAIAQVGGKKQLIGTTELDVAITNQCGRLIANVIIAYNSHPALGPVGAVPSRRATRRRSRCCGRYRPWPGSTSIFLGRYLSVATASQSTSKPFWPPPIRCN